MRILLLSLILIVGCAPDPHRSGQFKVVSVNFDRGYCYVVADRIPGGGRSVLMIQAVGVQNWGNVPAVGECWDVETVGGWSKFTSKTECR